MKKIIVSTDNEVNYHGGIYLLMCDYEYNAFDYNGQQIKGLEFPGERIPHSYREGSDAYFSSSGLLEISLSSEPEVVENKKTGRKFLSIENPGIRFWNGSFHFRANSIVINAWDKIEVKVEPKKLEEDSYSAQIKGITLPKTEENLNIFGHEKVETEFWGAKTYENKFKGKGQEFIIKGIKGKDCSFKNRKLNIVNFESIEKKTATESSSSSDPSHFDSDIKKYNENLLLRKTELDRENSDIVYNQQDKKLARLVELGRDEWPQTKEQLKIVNDNSKIHELLDLKEKSEVNIQNEVIEKANQTKIEEFSKLMERKRVAILELEKIIQQTSLSEPTEPPSNSNDSTSQPETNPVANNNENSSQNIQEIAHSSLEEAQKKGKTEIKELLTRYGVKSSELTASLWENQNSWEQYLVSLSTSEKVSEFVKKSGENQQKLLSDEVSLETVHEQAKQQIQEIIQQYSGILEKLDKSVWNGENDWQICLEKLVTKEQKLAFVRQMREAIISKSKQKGKENASLANSPKFPWKAVIPVALIIGVVGFVLTIKIIRQKKKIKTKK